MAMKRLRTILSFFGMKGVVWASAGIAASLTLSVVELAIAILLQSLLASFGVLSANAEGYAAKFAPLLTQERLVIALLVVGVIRSLAQYFSMQSPIVVREIANAKLKYAALHEMLTSEHKHTVSASNVNSLVGDVFPKASWFSFHALHSMSFGIQVFGLSIVMMVLSWKVASVGILALGGVGLIVFLINRKARKVAAKVPEEHTKLTKAIQRVSQNWLLVRLMKTTESELQKSRNSISRYFHDVSKSSNYVSIASALTPFLGILLLVAIIWASQNIFYVEGLTLLSFLYLFVRFVQILSTLANQLGHVNHYFPQASLAAPYVLKWAELDAPDFLAESDGQSRSSSDSVQYLDGAKDQEVAPPSVEVRALEFTYAQSPTPTLRNISTYFPAGGQYGIVGSSGSGKSTLLGLLTGVLQPTKGNILVGGKACREYYAADTHNIGYVGPEPFIIEGSIESNLRYGLRRDVSEGELWDALEKVSLSQAIRALPEGLGSVLSETGDGLSAGQKQRLCLARAILNESELLFLDEASANLDEETESLIAESLKLLKGKATLFAVSHRPAFLKHCDAVYMVDGGRLMLLGED